MTHEIPLLTDLVIIVGCSLPVLFLFRRLGLPPIAGFVMTGILIGPYGLGLINEIENVEIAAEVGVVLLLFMVGMEISLSGLAKISKRVYVLAVAQIVVISVASTALCLAIGLSMPASVVIGFAMSISSSAIVLKGLNDKGELNTPLGRIVVTICMVEDFAIIPMMLVVGILGTGSGGNLYFITVQTVSVLLLVGGLYVFGKYMLPYALKKLITQQNSELILLFTILVLCGTAWVTSLTGMSLALGAFAAGLILSETEFSAQIFAEVSPFQTLFSSIFFVSIGMLLDIQFVLLHPLPVILVSVGVLLLKTGAMVLNGSIARMTFREKIQGGFYLAQIGEFSFLLLGAAITGGLIQTNEFQFMIAAAALTLAVTPIIMHWAPRVAWQAESKLSSTATGLMALEMGETRSRPSPAVLIVGYGLNGRNVARVLSEAAIYHEILDGNPQTVRRARDAGEMVHYGDATRIEVLKHLRFEEFDSAVLAISDAAATRRAVAIMKAINTDAHLIVRTRYVKEVEDLAKLGADVVVPEEFETSLRIFSELLIHYHIPPHIIAAQIDLVRRQSYGMLRSSIGFDASTNLQSLLMQRLVEAVPIDSGSPVIGKTPAGLGLKQDERCFVISIIRNNEPITGSFDDVSILENDLIVLYGDHAALNEALRKFQ